MGIFDAAKDQAANLAGEHSDKVEGLSDQGIEKAGDFADEKSGGKFSEHVDSAQEQADQRIGE